MRIDVEGERWEEKILDLGLDFIVVDTEYKQDRNKLMRHTIEILGSEKMIKAVFVKRVKRCQVRSRVNFFLCCFTRRLGPSPHLFAVFFTGELMGDRRNPST